MTLPRPTAITQAAFAKLKNVTRAQVYKAVKSGKLKTHIDAHGSKVLHLDEALSDWKLNIASGTSTNPSGTAVPKPSGSSGPQLSDDEVRENSTAKTLNESRAVKAMFDANLAKLEYREKIGELIDAKLVKQSAFKAARVTRDAILGIPDRLAHELAGETDVHTVHTMLTKALVEALDELVRMNTSGN